MDTKGIVEKLSKLIQLDVDAVYAYEQAIRRIDSPVVQSALRRFQADHERHIDDLSDYIRKLGEEPPERSQDFKGFVIQGFTAVRSMMGTEGALKAMKSNEETTNQQYREASLWLLPNDAQVVIQRNYDDERRHLAYVKQALEERTWEKAA